MDTIKNTAKSFTKGLFKPDNKLSLIPNWLSFSRIIGGIAIPIMAYTGTSLPILFGTVSFLAVSDFLDGKAARIIAKSETKEGAMLDAVSDKIFSLALIIGILPVMPVFAINGVLEGTIALVNAKLLSKGGSPKSNFLGKVKIWPLSIALVLGYLALAVQNLNIVGITNKTLLTLSTILSVGTMPLQALNIKQYFEEYKTQTQKKSAEPSDENQHDIKNELNQNKEKTKEKKITPKFTLSKESHQAMVYELENTEIVREKIEEKEKVYTKKNKY